MHNTCPVGLLRGSAGVCSEKNNAYRSFQCRDCRFPSSLFLALSSYYFIYR